MAKTLQIRRLLGMAALLGTAFSVVGMRLVELQVVRHEELAARARQQTHREVAFEPRRGEIRDRNGIPLARSLPAKAVYADPSLLGGRHVEVAHAIAPLLEQDPRELARALEPRYLTRSGGEQVTVQYVSLGRRVSRETWEEIRRRMEQLAATHGQGDLKRAVTTEGADSQIRYYPGGRMAAHVLGFLNYEGEGVHGIELMFNEKLKGIRGWRRTEVDSSRHELVAFRDQNVKPEEGLNVILTLDERVQGIVEAELAETLARFNAVSASAVVARPRTGEILAMATLPNFDPNDPGREVALNGRNRVISDQIEPGSTFKIVAVSAALNEGLLSLQDRIDCEQQRFLYAGRYLRDTHPYGLLTVQEVIAKSSNIGTAKIALRLGGEGLYEYMQRFGYGRTTGLPLPNEVTGTVYPPARWDGLMITRIPMGQAVAVTPIQMVMAYSAIANGGNLMRPILVDRLEDASGVVVARNEPTRIRRVISEEVAADMVESLKMVVSSNGTARMAQLEHYRVAGKTGTAQKPEAGRYAPGKYVASFIGFFPADKPEVCIYVVVDEPKPMYYGSVVAVPAFKNIAQRLANYLNIPPDSPPAPRPPSTLVVRGVN
ncbi:MAG TPA: penicillin-binding transpeptidase domain-containing protein [Methylomirabilota bacterium]|nr:penicillin-binding transpeptidase domain-containing protein [Methylomirabilota bacterium]